MDRLERLLVSLTEFRNNPKSYYKHVDGVEFSNELDSINSIISYLNYLDNKKNNRI